MNKREKYIAAAEIISSIDGHTFACPALNSVGGDVEAFTEMFRPTKEEHLYVGENGLFFGVFFGNDSISENQLARSLALLFMAELDK